MGKLVIFIGKDVGLEVEVVTDILTAGVVMVG